MFKQYHIKTDTPSPAKQHGKVIFLTYLKQKDFASPLTKHLHLCYNITTVFLYTSFLKEQNKDEKNLSTKKAPKKQSSWL